MDVVSVRGMEPVLGQRSSDRAAVGDAGRGEPVEDRRPLRLVAFEVAGLAPESDRQLRHHPPGEMLEPIGPLVAGGEDGGRQALRVPVLVATDRAGVVRRDDPAPHVPVRIELGTDDQDQPEVRELVVRQSDRPAAEERVDVLEPIGMERRPDPVSDRRGADEGSGRQAPCVDRQMLGQLRRDQVRGGGRDRQRGGLESGRSLARPAESLGLGQPGEVLRSAREVDPPGGRRQEIEHGFEERRLAGPLVETGDDDRHPGLDEDPCKGGELGVEHAAGDQLDDRSTRRRDQGAAIRPRFLHAWIMARPGRSAAWPSSTEAAAARKLDRLFEMVGPFVGREHELEVLTQVARRGRATPGPSVVIVEGLPGSGKSRLLAEAASRTPSPRAVRVAGFEPMESIALGVVGELLRLLATVPQDGQRLAALVHGEVADLGAEPIRVFEAAHRALLRLGPCHLAIDDLQWVDRASLALIDYLVRAAEGRHQLLTVVAAGRPSRALSGFARRMENELPPDRWAHLELAPLSRDAGRQLARALDRNLTDAAAVDIWSRATGSPFWLELLARASTTEDPATAIGQRLRGIGPDAGRLLAALSVAGRPISVDDLGAMLTWPVRRVVGARQELITLGLALESIAGLATAHDLIREAALHELPTAVRRQLDARLAEGIERDADDDVLLLREALVHRRAAGRPSTDLALRIVSARLSRLLSVEDLHLLAAMSDELPAGSDDRIDLDRRIAALAAQAGDLELASGRWERIASDAADATIRQHACLEAARAAYGAGHGERVHAWLDRVENEAPVAAELSVTIDAIRADALLWLDHESVAGQEIASRAVATAERLLAEVGSLAAMPIEGRRAYLAALEAAGDAALQLERADEIVRLADACVEVAQGIGGEARIAALNRAAFANRPLGRVVEAERLSRMAWDEGGELIMPSAMVEAGHLLARTLRDLGRIPEAHRIATDTVEMEARLRNPSRRWGNALNVLHTIELCLEDPAACLRRLGEDARGERDPHYRLAIHLTIATWLARTAGNAAEQEIVAALDAARADSRLARCPRCAAQLRIESAGLLARIGRLDEAVELLEADRGDLPRTYRPRWLWRSRAIAEIAHASGDHATSIRVLHDVAAAAASAGLLEELVWIWLDVGRVSMDVDRDEAVAAVRRAAALADQIGAPTHARIAARALRALGVRTWRRTTSGAADSTTGMDPLSVLSGREREVAGLVANGQSNREIAALLDISPKTVERHLTNVLAKVGLRNRTELATLVRAGPVRGFPDE